MRVPILAIATISFAAFGKSESIHAYMTQRERLFESDS